MTGAGLNARLMMFAYAAGLLLLLTFGLGRVLRTVLGMCGGTTRRGLKRFHGGPRLDCAVQPTNRIRERRKQVRPVLGRTTFNREAIDASSVHLL